MDVIQHHGVLGQKWGVRRYQDKDGRLTSAGREHYKKADIKELIDKKDKTYNLDKWGTSPDNNLLIIAGLSGSGKSTLSKNIKDVTNAEYIELDKYYQFPGITNVNNKHFSSKEFDKYLSKNVPEYDKLAKIFEDNNYTIDLSNKEYWDTMDKVRDALFDFSKEQYGKHKVIAEGIQFLDSAMYQDINERRKIIRNNPSIIKQTSLVKSTLKGILRDNVSFLDLPTINSKFQANKHWNKKIKDITFDL